MTPELSLRLSSICSGIIPEGYKKTKAGIIPEDWQVVRLADVLKKQTKKNRENAIHNILTNSATRGIISQTDYFDKQIANDENTDGYYVVEPGYFVYNPRISVNAPCGPFNRYNGEKQGIMSPLYSVYKFVDKNQGYSDYLACFFASSHWHPYMYGIANYGARSDRMNVTSEDMDNLPIPYPEKEFEKIAAILAAQDKVVELTKKLVEQKKKQKELLSRSLLYGKKRIHGNRNPWKKVKLENICEINPRTLVDEEYVSFLGMTDVSEEGRILHQELVPYSTVKTGFTSFRRGDILVAKITPCFENGKGAVTDSLKTECGFASTEFHVLRAKKNVLSDFIFYHTQLSFFRKKLEKEMTGTAGQKRIQTNSLAKYSILLPEISEQAAIVGILKTMDREVELMERKIELEKDKKKALMQLMLMGIVRVK